jgi:AraC-like DNA-binding protein
MSGLSLLIRSASLAGFLELARELDLPATTLLKRVGLNREMLDQPEHPIRLEAVCRLLELSASQSGCETFGLRMAAKRRLAHLGTVGIVMREQPSGSLALQTLTRYLQLVNPGLVSRIERLGETILIREEIVSGQALPVRQAIEMAVGVMHGLVRELLSVQGKVWSARQVCFSHRAPSDLKATAEIKRFFGCPVQFNTEFDGLVCSAMDLDQQLPDRDSQRASHAQWSLDNALSQIRRDAAHAVGQLIAVLLPQGDCSAERVAAHLGVDRRTVHRQLAALDTSFGQLLHKVRSELAQRQLRESDRSATEIAQLLGFGSASAFAHWFAGQHGMSASSWRMQSHAPNRPLG